MTAILAVGEQIREARIKKGLTQTEVEKALGWPRTTLSAYERGKCSIPEERKEAVFKCLGLGEEKVSDFFRFKETKPVKPVEDKSPDRFGPKKNHEGYSDPTMAAALRNMTIKYTDHMPGEMWRHKRKNGSSVKKLILSIQGNMAICISAFANGSQLDHKIKTASGNVNYISLEWIEAINLKELEERTDIVSEKYMDGLRQRLAEILEIRPQEKIVEKEVPVEVEVEKIVEKEVPVEVPVEVEKEVIVEVRDEKLEQELALAKTEARIYKDAFERVCNAMGGMR